MITQNDKISQNDLELAQRSRSQRVRQQSGQAAPAESQQIAGHSRQAAAHRLSASACSHSSRENEQISPVRSQRDRESAQDHRAAIRQRQRPAHRLTPCHSMAESQTAHSSQQAASRKEKSPDQGLFFRFCFLDGLRESLKANTINQLIKISQSGQARIF